MTDDPSIYDELGVPTVVNAAGTKTRLGGSRIRPEAADAMRAAAESFVRLSDLQARAGELITEVTGAEAGYVASGAAGALTLATAACIAGDDLDVMARLPDTEGVPSDVVMPRTHRTGYDHAIRAAGASIVDVGTNDRALGTGAVDVETWELAAAITDDTVAVAHVQTPDGRPALETIVAVAHDHGVPVVVDAAAQLPPAENLSAFVERGADLVAFSGGKAIRGPQSTGILAGRADLVESAALQHLDMHAAAPVWDPPAELVDLSRFDGVPRQGIGRGLKVGKEELVGLVRALERFVEEDHEALQADWRARATSVADALADVDGLTTAVEPGGKTAAPVAVVTVEAAAAGVDAVSFARQLRRDDPRVFVGSDRLDEGMFTVDPTCLTDEEAAYVVERVRSAIE